MCGLVGLIARSSGGFPAFADDLFTLMVQYDSIRGPDSTGVMGITKGKEIDVIKGDADGYVFTQTKNYLRFYKHIYQTYAAVFGHNRKATVGKVTPHNAHPFQEGNITLMHNGTIRNKEALDKEVEVDSHAIAMTLAKKDAKAALGSINGAYALIWYDKSSHTIQLARNNERPLYLIEYDNLWAVASEPGLPLWLQGREGRVSKKVLQVPTDKLFVFDLANLHEPFTEVPYDDYASVQQAKLAAEAADRAKHARPFVTHAPPERPSMQQQVHQSARAGFVSHPNSGSAKPVKAGDQITFRVTKLDEEDQSVLIGHPLIDGEEMKDQFVRATLPRGVDTKSYLEGEALYTGEVVSVGTIHRHWVFFLGPRLSPARRVVAFGGEHYLLNQKLMDVLAQGCNKCSRPISSIEVPSTIIQPKATQWRVICQDCRKEAQAAALREKMKETPHVTH